MKQVQIVGILILFLTVQSFSNLIRSQETTTTSSGGFNYGVHVGITGSNFTNEQPGRSIVVDYTAGIHGKYSFSESFGVQGELNYLEQGGGLIRITDPEQLGTNPIFDYKVEDQKVSIRSLELPIVMMYSFGVGSSKINLMAGPGVAWVFHAGSKIETTARYPSYPSVYTTFSDEENITENITPFIYNAVGGLGIEFPFIGETKLYLDVRYRYSINDVYNGYSYLGIEGVSADLNQQSLTINLGLTL
jgi:hypothetical protein